MVYGLNHWLHGGWIQGQVQRDYTENTNKGEKKLGLMGGGGTEQTVQWE